MLDGMNKEELIDFLLEADTYEDDERNVISVPPIIKSTQQKAAEDYYDSLPKPKTVAPTEVLDEDAIKNKPEGYAGPNPKAPNDANSWQTKMDLSITKLMLF